VFDGERPGKPENPPAIGFPDELWDFAQHCWDGEMRSWPKAMEVVMRLRETATRWNGLMPTCPQADDNIFDPGELLLH